MKNMHYDVNTVRLNTRYHGFKIKSYNSFQSLLYVAVYVIIVIKLILSSNNNNNIVVIDDGDQRRRNFGEKINTNAKNKNTIFVNQ